MGRVGPHGGLGSTTCVAASNLRTQANRLTLGHPSGRTATASFDSLERIASLTEGGQSVASFAYAGRGRMASVTLGGSLAKQSWSYNGVTGVNNAAGDFGVGLPTAANTIALQNGATLDSQAFSWDRGQNKRIMSDSAPGLTALTRTNAYDSLSRLTATAGTAYGAGAQVTLDAANNRVSVTGGLHPGSYSMSTAVPPADSPVNQYTNTPMGAATHDATGNLASLPDPLGAWGMTATALYDYAARMVSWTAGTGTGQRAVSYRYDALGRLLRRQEQSGVQTVEVTDFAYAGWQLAEERRNMVPTGQTAVMTYLYGGGLDQLVASRKDSEPLTFYAADDQGSIVMAGTAAAGVVERYNYDDFGRPQVLAPNGTPRTASLIGNRVLYTGRWLDPVAGLYNYRTRWMSPELGRFTSRDTIGIWGDIGNLGNGTAYVGNDPWNWVDPWGERGTAHWRPHELQTQNQPTWEAMYPNVHWYGAHGEPGNISIPRQNGTGDSRVRGKRGAKSTSDEIRNTGWTPGTPVVFFSCRLARDNSQFPQQVADYLGKGERVCAATEYVWMGRAEDTNGTLYCRGAKDESLPIDQWEWDPSKPGEWRLYIGGETGYYVLDNNGQWMRP